MRDRVVEAVASQTLPVAGAGHNIVWIWCHVDKGFRPPTFRAVRLCIVEEGLERPHNGSLVDIARVVGGTDGGGLRVFVLDMIIRYILKEEG